MGKRKGHTPIRTCIVCRKKRRKGELVRLVADHAGRVRKDDRGNGPGRGAYVCPEGPCVEGVARPGLLSRAFKKKVIR